MGLGAGLGKTRVAIEIKQKSKMPCLVICPAYLILNWVNEINLWSIGQPKYLAVKKGSDIPTDPKGLEYLIISYDMVKKAEHLFEFFKMVILDECPNVKSMRAQRTQFIHKAIYENNIERLHLLTGTPIKNRVAEFYSLLALCNYDPSAPDSEFLDKYPDEITFADFFSYRHEYDMDIGNKTIKIVKWDGVRNIPELKKYLAGHYIRIKTEDALDLPPVTYIDTLVSETQDTKLMDAFNAQHGSEESDGVDPRAKAESAFNKTPFTIQYARNLLEQEDCILIYSDHVAASEALAKEFGVVALNGSVPAHRRMEIAKRFQEGGGHVLVATIGALSEGVTLTRSSHLILNDYPWVPGNMEQVVRRIARLSQTKKCFVHRILGSPQDSKILDILESKQNTIDKVT